MRVIPDDDAGRAAAIAVLREGGVVAFPTDTVYGIAVAPAIPNGVERLFHVKRRPADKGIALLLADADQAGTVGLVDSRARRLAARFWPGPLTLILPARTAVGNQGANTDGPATVGVRLPDHPTPRALAAALGPLPTTSANLSGQPDAVEAAEVVAMLGDRIDLVLDGGRTRGAIASTVVDLSVDPLVVRREGPIGSARILALLGTAEPGDSSRNPGSSPGSSS